MQQPVNGRFIGDEKPNDCYSKMNRISPRYFGGGFGLGGGECLGEGFESFPDFWGQQRRIGLQHK